MLQFDKISVNQILFFSEIVNESSLLQKDFIEEQYIRNASYYLQTIEFLCGLDLIEVINNQIIIKPKYKEFLKSLNESQLPREIIKKFIIDCLVKSRKTFSNYFNEFFSQFKFIYEHYEFTPTSFERLKYSGLRNFLIDIGFIYLDMKETKYIVDIDYSIVLSELLTSEQLHPNEFLKICLANEEIGRVAELEIIEYEKKLLSCFPYLSEKIEHTAKLDVRAGYDIKSYEIPTGNESHTPKYIEVKAGRHREINFYIKPYLLKIISLYGQEMKLKNQKYIGKSITYIYCLLREKKNFI